MALTESNMLELGSTLPSFTLPEVIQGDMISSPNPGQYEGILILFICNHCPYVIHVLPEIVKISKDYQNGKLKIIAISSNDVERYPDDSPEFMKSLALKEGFNFPYCYDESQDVAKLFQAACTPDFYLFNTNLELVYRGRLDGSRPGNDVELNGKDLRLAIDALLSGLEPVSAQFPSVGCSIKWKV